MSCHIQQTCACGASLDFSEDLPYGAWPHEHRCTDAQIKFNGLHKHCMELPKPKKMELK